MNQNLADALFAAFLIGLIFTVWCSVLIVIARAGGWHELSLAYRAAESVSGQKWWFQSAWLLPFTRYNHALTVRAAPEGLGMSVFPLFRIGHPPLLIPWKDIQTQPQAGWFGYRYVVLSLAKSPDISIAISERLANRLHAAVGNLWPSANQASLPHS